MVELRKQFQKELNKLHKMLLKMNTAVKTNIDGMILALKNNDCSLAKKVVDDDDYVDKMEVEIEAFCINILISQQPVASDFREVTAALKMTTDIERISDYCSSVCEHFLKIKPNPNSTKCILKIIDLGQNAKLMFNNMMEAFLSQDDNKLKQIIEKDSISDEIYSSLEDCIAKHFEQIEIKNTINFILIGRALERMADHITNVCDWILFKSTGKINK